MRRFVIGLLLVPLVACGGSRTATERAHAIEGQVWSPYCPGRLLIDCTTAQARTLRTEIASRVDAGQDEDEVIAWIQGEFGEGAVARPDASAAGLVIWLAPLLVFLVGGAVVLRRLRTHPIQEEQHADP